MGGSEKWLHGNITINQELYYYSKAMYTTKTCLMVNSSLVEYTTNSDMVINFLNENTPILNGTNMYSITSF